MFLCSARLIKTKFRLQFIWQSARTSGIFTRSCDGAALGATSHTDFKLFCSIVKELNGGGVYLNLGSAVVMPEIFLKAVTVVRNLGFPLEDFTTANFDFIQHYRPLNECRSPPDSRRRGTRIFRDRSSRNYDSTACRAYFMRRLKIIHSFPKHSKALRFLFRHRELSRRFRLNLKRFSLKVRRPIRARSQV